jgi:hypothetical protein
VELIVFVPAQHINNSKYRNSYTINDDGGSVAIGSGPWWCDRLHSPSSTRPQLRKTETEDLPHAGRVGREGKCSGVGELLCVDGVSWRDSWGDAVESRVCVYQNHANKA